ncbi:MAG TPA: FAD-linked oxidase C-terminal domain-containing protein [Thermodesulfobacteriota bacterium]|nr:FAD-linked oxidase C-terminal domain-containing protein [Thermodesulfobacteriota bacterium]
MYRPVDESVVRRLTEIAGPKAIFSDEDTLTIYSKDETLGLSHRPEIVVKPGTSKEILEIMRLANLENIPLTPRGKGTGLSGGAIPVYGGIVLSCERMEKILDIDHENLMVVTEPGIITGELQKAVEAEGLFYPPDPASLASCSIGGNVAEGAGGSRAVKYGTTKDYVNGLEVVLPSGEMISTGGKVVKDVTGYNLTQLITGSEGTMAIVTRIILRLVPLPKLRRDLLVPYPSIDQAAQTVSEIIRTRIVPTAIEFMERKSFELAESFTKRKLTFREAAAHLLITLDGNQQEALDEDQERVGEICEKNGAFDILIANSPTARDRMWESRKCLFEAANHFGSLYKSLDVVVPRSLIPTLIRKIDQVSETHGIRAMSFGHAGDGNVHVLLFKGELLDEEWERLIDRAQRDLYKATIDLGGKITAEHGIGLLRKPFLSMNLDPFQIELLKGLKKTFDPKNILNPGKIFDLQSSPSAPLPPGKK